VAGNHSSLLLFRHILTSARPADCDIQGWLLQYGVLARLPTCRPPAPDCPAEEACTLEACYVAAFRMKQRGMVMHDKLDKAAVSWHHLFCHLYSCLLLCSACSPECSLCTQLCVCGACLWVPAAGIARLV
jgi:hypothetical protein